MTSKAESSHICHDSFKRRYKVMFSLFNVFTLSNAIINYSFLFHWYWHFFSGHQRLLRVLSIHDHNGFL